MCEFATIAAVASAAAGIVGAVNQAQQGKAQANMYRYQAAVEETNAALREDDRLKAMKRNISTQTAQFGALGTNPLTGSGPLTMAETARNSYYDIFNDNFSSEQERNALQASAANAQRSGNMAAAGTLLKTTASVADRYA